MPNLPNGSKGGFEPGSLDCESGILPLSYRAPLSSPIFAISLDRFWDFIKFNMTDLLCEFSAIMKMLKSCYSGI